MATSFINSEQPARFQLDEAGKQRYKHTKQAPVAEAAIKTPSSGDHHVVVIGGGFGGLQAARVLGNVEGVRVTLVDKRNFHLFQPLLYQVATGGLSPGDIASPLRAVLSRDKNVTVLAAKATNLDPDNQIIYFEDGETRYDSLIIATGVSHDYFGKDAWAQQAPGLKSIEDALDIRRRILLAFEAAEREEDEAKRKALLTFVVVGAGPTGVELAGALAELANSTMKHDFRNIDPRQAQVILLEGADHVLPVYPTDLSDKAERSLREQGVDVRTNTLVTNLYADKVTVRHGDSEEVLPAHTVLWAAGMKASGLGRVLADRTGVALDRAGRVMVEPDLSIAGYPHIFVVGDLAHFAHQDGKPLPGLAPVAKAQGDYAARRILGEQKGEDMPPFHYKDKGSMAVIGRNSAVVNAGRVRFSGFFAWLAWIFIHIGYLIEFDSKVLVLIQWAWNYFTRKRGARLITGDTPYDDLSVKRFAVGIRIQPVQVGII